MIFATENNLSNLIPYYHPTKTLFVDDNSDFLKAFSPQLKLEDSALHLCQDPNKALSVLNTIPKPFYQRCFNKQKVYPEEQGNELPCNIYLGLDFYLMLEDLTRNQRFDEVSVAIIDYDMPFLNGLELAQQIKNPYTKKILLSGIADEKIAIEAFHKGLIDRYVFKQEPNLNSVVSAMVCELQKEYFVDLGKLFPMGSSFFLS